MNKIPDTHQNTDEPRSIVPEEGDKLNVPIAIVFAGLLIAGAIIFTDQRGGGVGLTPPPPGPGVASTDVAVDLLELKKDDHVLGNPNADVLIIVYSDTECPFCQRYHSTMNQVMDEFAQSGQVAWVYRHFPLDIHPKARKEAEGLECANELGGNAAFWKYTDKIFEITPGNNNLDLAMLPKVAEMVGLNVGEFTACLDSGKYASRVQRDFENGANVGVNGTPHSIIWNRKTGRQIPVKGALPFASVQAQINSILLPPVTK